MVFMSKKLITQIWERNNMDKQINRTFKGKQKAEITQKQLKDYSIKLLHTLLSQIGKELLKRS